MRSKKSRTFLKIFLTFVVMAVTLCGAAWANDGELSFASADLQPVGIANNGALEVNADPTLAATTVYALSDVAAGGIKIQVKVDSSKFAEPTDELSVVASGDWAAEFAAGSSTDIILTSTEDAANLAANEDVAITVSADNAAGDPVPAPVTLTLTVNMELVSLPCSMDNVALDLGVNYTGDKAVERALLTAGGKALGSKQMVFLVSGDTVAQNASHKLWDGTDVLADLAPYEADPANSCGLVFSSVTERLQGEPNEADITVSLGGSDAALLVLDDNNAIVAGVAEGDELATVNVKTDYSAQFAMLIEDIEFVVSQDVASADYQIKFSELGVEIAMPQLETLYFDGAADIMDWNGLTLTLDKDTGVLSIIGTPEVEEKMEFTVKATMAGGEISDAVFTITVGEDSPATSGGGSSGGCDAGFGVLALGLLAASVSGFAVTRKKRN